MTRDASLPPARPAHRVDRGAAAREPLARPGPGVLRRRHDRGADRRSRPHRRAASDLADLGHEVQGRAPPAARDRARAGRGRRRRGLGAARRRPRAHHGAAHRGRHRPPSVGGALRARLLRRARHPERGRAGGGERDPGPDHAAGARAPRRHAAHRPEAHEAYLKGASPVEQAQPRGARASAGAVQSRDRARPHVRAGVLGAGRLSQHPRRRQLPLSGRRVPARQGRGPARARSSTTDWPKPTPHWRT